MSDKITEDLGKLFEKLESVARETKLEEKKKIDYVETTESDISSLFAELEKVSQETKKLNEDDKDKLYEFANIFTKLNEEYPEDLPSDVEPKPDPEPEKNYEEPPEDDPTDDVSDKGDLQGWIEKKVDTQPKDIVEQIVGQLDDMRYQTEVKEELDEIEKLRKEFEQYKNVLQNQITKNLATSSGGGEVKIQNMDDIDTSTALVDKNVLRFNATTGKFDGVALETEDLILETGSAVLLDGTDSDGSDAGSRIDLEDGTFGGVAVDLSAVAQDIIPDQNSTRSLGTSSKRFKELFLAGSTIDLGGSVISSDGTGGNISLSASGVTLPSGSSIESDTIAVAATNGKTSVDVDFFSRAGGTSTANATFKFQSVGNSYVFTDSGSFTLSDGTALEDSNPELFTF